MKEKKEQNKHVAFYREIQKAKEASTESTTYH
jgi:hypothetical protein